MKIKQHRRVETLYCYACAGTGVDRGGEMCDACYGDGQRVVCEPAIGECECGREVALDAFTCPCECGRDYNFAGHLLAPRSQWGEETGEHWTECF